MTEYVDFRRRLDAVLRTRDVQRVSAFLIAEGQWEPGAPADPQFAMWMMIAGASTLKDLYTEARAWLIEHGHATEAEAILSRGPVSKPAGHSRSGSGKGKQAGQSRTRARSGPGAGKSSEQGRTRSRSGAGVSKKRQQ